MALLHDLRFARRQLFRNPGFAAAAIVILGLGIGINAAVFSIVNALLFRPLPVSAPADLVSIYGSTPGELMATSALTTADYEDLAELSQSFTAVLAGRHRETAVASSTITCP